MNQVDAALASQSPVAASAHSTATISKTELRSSPDVTPNTPLRQVNDAMPGQCKAVLASPAVRGMAHKKGIDLANVSGSGPSGRVLKVDIERHCSTAEGEGHISFRLS